MKEVKVDEKKKKQPIVSFFKRIVILGSKLFPLIFIELGYSQS